MFLCRGSKQLTWLCAHLSRPDNTPALLEKVVGNFLFGECSFKNFFLSYKFHVLLKILTASNLNHLINWVQHDSHHSFNLWYFLWRKAGFNWTEMCLFLHVFSVLKGSKSDYCCSQAVRPRFVKKLKKVIGIFFQKL